MTIVDFTIVNVALGVRASAMKAGFARLWNIPASARRAGIRVILGRPGGRLRIHDRALLDIAARHPLHEPFRSAHPRLGAPR